MRHGKKLNHLSRKTAHRKAMLSNMACSLIEHKRIHTTVAKAKALRVYVEPLLTKSKTDSTHSRRIVFRYLQSKDAVTELFRDVAPKIADRPGGYTRIIRIGNRLGDNAEMCMVELVDFNELMLNADKPEKKTTRRSRRGGSSSSKAKTSTDTAAETKTETKKDTPKAEAKKEEPKKDAPKAEAKKETPKAETKKDAPKKETPKAEAKEETPKKEAPKAEAKKEEPKKDAPKEEAKKEDKPAAKKTAPKKEDKADDKKDDKEEK
jgi:large subunit ribosomal protein L17